MRLLTNKLTNENSFSNAYKKEILTCLCDSLTNNKAAVAHWQQMFITHMQASGEVLVYLSKFKNDFQIILNFVYYESFNFLDDNWSHYSKKLSSNSDFRPTLLAFEEHVDSVVVQKDGINQATGAVKVQF